MTPKQMVKMLDGQLSQAYGEIDRLRAVMLDIEDNPCCDACCGGAALKASVALMEGRT
jgi:hypothetical protein